MPESTFATVAKAAKRRWVYVIEEIGSPYIKIGSSSEPMGRLVDLQASTPHELRVVAMWEAERPGTVEAELHRRFQQARVRGEWFDATNDPLASWLRQVSIDFAPIPFETRYPFLVAKETN